MSSQELANTSISLKKLPDDAELIANELQNSNSQSNNQQTTAQETLVEEIPDNSEIETPQSENSDSEWDF